MDKPIDRRQFVCGGALTRFARSGRGEAMSHSSVVRHLRRG